MSKSVVNKGKNGGFQATKKGRMNIIKYKEAFVC